MDRDIFLFPFKSGPLTANVTFALLFWICSWLKSMAGMFGLVFLVAEIILIMLYSHYAIDVSLDAGYGRAEQNVFKFSGFRPQYLFFFICLIALSYFLYHNLGPWLSAIMISIIVPASIAAMAVEKQLLSAMNPIVLLSYIRLYRTDIMLPISAIWILVFTSQLLSTDSVGILYHFVYLSVFLWLFYTVGHVVVSQVIERQPDPLTSPAKVFVNDEALPERSFEQLSDDWHHLNNVREITKALGSINSYISSQKEQAVAAQIVMEELSEWRNTRLAYRFLPDYLRWMAETRKYGLMFKYYRKLCIEHGAITVQNPDIRVNFLQFADAMDDQVLMEKLAE